MLFFKMLVVSLAPHRFIRGRIIGNVTSNYEANLAKHDLKPMLKSDIYNKLGINPCDDYPHITILQLDLDFSTERSKCVSMAKLAKLEIDLLIVDSQIERNFGGWVYAKHMISYTIINQLDNTQNYEWLKDINSIRIGYHGDISIMDWPIIKFNDINKDKAIEFIAESHVQLAEKIMTVIEVMAIERS